VNKRVILFVSLLALATVGALPWLWRWSPAVVWLCALVISAWCVWLMVLYLKWARTLGTTTSDQATEPADGGGPASAR
jgi:glucan phosphoethanolaminetransferase (alkaline phosphatase superfamily)